MTITEMDSPESGVYALWNPSGADNDPNPFYRPKKQGDGSWKLQNDRCPYCNGSRFEDRQCKGCGAPCR